MAHAHRTSSRTAAQRSVQLFEFSSAHVLESVVFSARSRRFEVCTGHRRNVTTVSCFTPERTVCTIDWDTKTIDVGVGDGRTPKRRIEEYLPLNPRRRTRRFSFGGVEYTWIPKKNGFSLYNKKTNEDMANIWTLPGHLPRVEIYCQSVNVGLLDSCVIAAVLFLSKRPLGIDKDSASV